jgi:hypothetical protein
MFFLSSKDFVSPCADLRKTSFVTFFVIDSIQDQIGFH